jgi:hypothetical protein
MEQMPTILATVETQEDEPYVPIRSTAGEVAPKLSVVIVALNAPAMLDRCLVALAQQVASEVPEILVVGHWRQDDQYLARLQQRFSYAQWVATPGQYTIPQRRSRGIMQSRGKIIALLEDDCLVNNKWCASVLAAHDAAYLAIGGPIEPGDYQKGLDWAVYFYEYGRFMMPFAGAVSALPGNNVTYKREAFVSINQDKGFYEVFAHLQLQQQGETLFADPKLVVQNINNWPYLKTLGMAYHHGRAFAGMRVMGWPVWRKVLYASATLFLPLLQMTRIIKKISRSKRYVLPCIFALPWLVLFSSSWAGGELLGYLFGAGQSEAQWR